MSSMGIAQMNPGGLLIEERDDARIDRLESAPRIAYRMWQVFGPEEAPLDTIASLTLHSLGSTETKWPAHGEWLEARCPHVNPDPEWVGSPASFGAGQTHEFIPGFYCSCGLFADDASPKAISRAQGQYGPAACGVVEFAGRIVVHEKGFRAQRGRIVSLRVMPSKIESLRTSLIEDGLIASGYPVVPWAKCAICSADLKPIEHIDGTWGCPTCKDYVLSMDEIMSGWISG